MLRSLKYDAKRKPVTTVGLLIAMTIAVLSLSAAGNAASGKSLVIDVSCTPNSLDPAATRSGECGVLAWEFYPTLVAWAAKPGPGPGTLAWDRSKVVPAVAQSWTISTNGRVYTFTLNPKAKFPDGTTITCQDVLFNFDRDTATKTTAQSFWGTGQTDNYPSMTCSNPGTVVMTLPTRPNPDLLLGLVQASMITEPSVINTHPDTTVNGVLTPDTYWASHIAGGGGPFLLTSYTPGSQMVARVNPDYVGPHVALSGITINFITDHTTLILNAQNGQADITTGLTVPGGCESPRQERLADVPVPLVELDRSRIRLEQAAVQQPDLPPGNDACDSVRSDPEDDRGRARPAVLRPDPTRLLVLQRGPRGTEVVNLPHLRHQSGEEAHRPIRGDDTRQRHHGCASPATRSAPRSGRRCKASGNRWGST